MLEAAGVPFEVAPAALDEDAAKAGLAGAGLNPRGIAGELARLKALSLAVAPSDLVLGADQVLEREDGSMLSKPQSRAEALDQLRSLSGATHLLHSAATIAQAGEAIWSHTDTAALTMRRFSDDFLSSYLAQEYEAIRWGVGGYRIEGPGAQLFERVEGSHFTIIGLPLLPLMAYLRERGVLAS